MEGSRRHGQGELKRKEEGSERRTEGEGKGTRWEHVSHTEIVNYSFVPRRVGVIWKRDARCEYRARPTEKEDGIEGGKPGENIRTDMYAHMRA